MKVWKTIKIGTHKNVAELKKSILDAGFRIGSWAKDVLDSPAFTLAPKESRTDLVRVTVGELGFPKGADRKEIYRRALEVGLALCPLEVGPQLRLQYPDQTTKYESLQIGMEPQKDSQGHESEFRVVHAGDDFLWLAGDHRHPDDFWEADEEFIFVKP